MSSILDHCLLPTVLRAGACRAHPTQEALERGEGARRRDRAGNRSCPSSLSTFIRSWVNSDHRRLYAEAHYDCYCQCDLTFKRFLTHKQIRTACMSPMQPYSRTEKGAVRPSFLTAKQGKLGTTQRLVEYEPHLLFLPLLPILSSAKDTAPVHICSLPPQLVPF